MTDGEAHEGVSMSTPLDTGFTQRLSTALVRLHTAGGFLLVFIFVGLILLSYLAIVQISGAKMYVFLALGSASLILPMIVVWLGFMRPVMELRKHLEEKSVFIANVQNAVLRLTSTIRGLTDEVIQNHDRIAQCLKIIRPHLDNYPSFAGWIDGAQNLSEDLIKNSLSLRDAANDMEAAVLSADASKLKNVIEEVSEIAERIEASSKAASIKKMIGEKHAQAMTAIDNSSLLAAFDKALSLALSIIDQEHNVSDNDSITRKIGALGKGIEKSRLWNSFVDGLKATYASTESESSGLAGEGRELKASDKTQKK